MSNKRFIIQQAKLVCLCEQIFWIFIYRVCVTLEGEQSMQSGTELAREIHRTDWSTAGNLSNLSSGVQILCDICTCLKHYLHSAKCSWIIKVLIWLFAFIFTSTVALATNNLYQAYSTAECLKHVVLCRVRVQRVQELDGNQHTESGTLTSCLLLIVVGHVLISKNQTW